MNDIHDEVKAWRWDVAPAGPLHGAMSDFRRTPALVLAFAGFLTQFDVTSVVVVLPSIGQELGFGMTRSSANPSPSRSARDQAPLTR
jgi:hypothetical protein